MKKPKLLLAVLALAAGAAGAAAPKLFADSHGGENPMQIFQSKGRT